MAEIFIPTLHSFENGNIFTGSCGTMRFRIVPKLVQNDKKEVDASASTIFCELWHGEKCYELSTMESELTVPLSEEGRAELKAWLEASAE